MDTSKTISCENVCFYLSIGLFVYYSLWIFGVVRFFRNLFSENVYLGIHLTQISAYNSNLKKYSLNFRKKIEGVIIRGRVINVRK